MKPPSYAGIPKDPPYETGQETDLYLKTVTCNHFSNKLSSIDEVDAQVPLEYTTVSPPDGLYLEVYC